MIRINLLPHREEARKQRRTQFYTLLGLVALLGGVVWFVGHTLIGQRIDAQESSNDFVKREIAVLDKEIAEIKRLQEQTQSLLSRKQVIESLQSNRAETVHIFNELGKQVPEGVFIRSVKQSGVRINLLGYAQSNARVSQLMRNLDASPIFEKPELVEIKAADFNRRRVGDFNLFVSIERAPIEDSDQNKSAAKEPAK
ncbi:PilN domain-containing protein [Uliginosibacterium sp. H3]|uniref:PilN domain-containing protein n=1 Tax=Uliginosibacterium silvisoli TaxID=3114758 RepID=A0ABU6K0E3_9RHOO|nr:PilN domain-containing protein [Uliginosibacterium sp. H3]